MQVVRVIGSPSSGKSSLIKALRDRRLWNHLELCEGGSPSDGDIVLICIDEVSHYNNELLMSIPNGTYFIIVITKVDLGTDTSLIIDELSDIGFLPISYGGNTHVIPTSIYDSSIDVLMGEVYYLHHISHI